MRNTLLNERDRDNLVAESAATSIVDLFTVHHVGSQQQGSRKANECAKYKEIMSFDENLRIQYSYMEFHPKISLYYLYKIPIILLSSILQNFKFVTKNSRYQFFFNCTFKFYLI